MENTYWNNKGVYESLVKQLEKRIPVMGECDKRLPKLERLRKAINLYYALYNNGGCNYASAISRFFGIRCSEFVKVFDCSHEPTEKKIEAKMDQLIMDAAIEAIERTDVFASVLDKTLPVQEAKKSEVLLDEAQRERVKEFLGPALAEIFRDDAHDMAVSQMKEMSDQELLEACDFKLVDGKVCYDDGSQWEERD